ncbi:hypothetical protein [Hyunsoonleella pacifica]|uniref:Uncharacterized protein n=1 Tax=Hyunsoonleella pacifica TaxID=1080224 RepID=A0A4V6MT82_9FLAO|nr:hypothetical protein [Hyunsoonleella pacifica]TBN16333.1 hypothetical protein EYD46_06715 [Hyunsoonleella pacifica]GGD20334.1 hypothetical protein GCM10011368_22820 [Hyunsoonleella pacifica]
MEELTNGTENDLESIKENIPIDNLAITKNENEIYEEKNKGSKNRHKHNVFVCSLYLLWTIAILILLVRFYHFIASPTYQWLSAEQIQSLDKLLFTGAFGAGLGKYGNKLFD